ncbi:hypothetical protein [Tetragenococcus halophilus]|nr:hypothetical protein [Tetragenococcus halophilus]
MKAVKILIRGVTEISGLNQAFSLVLARERFGFIFYAKTIS